MHKKLKILMIHDVYSDVGGAEVLVKNTIKELKSRGHDIFHFSFGQTKIEEDRVCVVKESRLKLIRYYNGVFISIKGYLRLKKAIKEFNPDIIHIHNIDRYISTILLPIKDKRVVRTIYDYGIVCPSLWGIHKDDQEVCDQGIGMKCIKHGCINPLTYPIYHHLFYKKHKYQKEKVTSYTVVTNRLKGYMNDLGFKNISVFPYFTDKQIDSIKMNDDNIILYIGNLEKNKGVEYALRMMPLVLKEVPQAKIILLGTGRERKNLENLGKELGIMDCVTFAGKVPNKEVDSYYKKSSIVVTPSLWMENSPVVIYEALAFGKPVITSDRGGNPELIQDGQNGFVTKAGDHERMAECAIELLKDRKKLKMFSQNALQTSKKFTLNNYIDNMERVYFDLMKEEKYEGRQK